jgi:hypothetical protein
MSGAKMSALEAKEARVAAALAGRAGECAIHDAKLQSGVC